MTIPEELKQVLTADAETLSGAVRFKGTRVPVQHLLDTLYSGQTVDYFLDDFPDVSKEQVMAVIRWEQNSIRAALGLDLVA